MSKMGMEKREEILGFIKGYVSVKNYPPTIRKIADGVNLKSTSSVHSQLIKLEGEGRLIIDRNRLRAIRVIW